MKEYEKIKNEFYKKHGEEYTESSELSSGQTIKHVYFDDGAEWTEIYGGITEYAQVEVKGIKFDVKVNLFKIKYWNTDDSKSKFAYEKY